MASERIRSDPVDQDVQRALQRVAVGDQMPDRYPQIHCGDRGQLLHTDDPALVLRLDHWRQPREGDMGPLGAQGGDDARGVEADQIRLQVDDQKPVT